MGQVASTILNLHHVDYDHPRTRFVTLGTSPNQHSINDDVSNIYSNGREVKVQKISVVRNSVNLKRKSLGLINYGNNIYLLTFTFDAIYDVEVAISFCCLEQVTERQETVFIPTKYTTFRKIFPKSVNTTYISDINQAINLRQMNINDLKWKPSYENIVPILITLKALDTDIPQVQYTLAYLQENEIKENEKLKGECPYQIVIYRQKIQIGNRVLEMKEIFGIEKVKPNVEQNREQNRELKTEIETEIGTETGTENRVKTNTYTKAESVEINPIQSETFTDLLSGRECVICLSEERNTVVLPCRHMCLCETCTNIVRIQSSKCPICRQMVTGFLQMTFEDKSKMDQLHMTHPM